MQCIYCDAPLSEKDLICPICGRETARVSEALARAEAATLQTTTSAVTLPQTPIAEAVAPQTPLSEIVIAQAPVPSIEDSQPPLPGYLNPATYQFPVQQSSLPPVRSFQPVKPRDLHKLAQAMPWWLFIPGLLLTFGMIGACYYLGKDWAQGVLYIAYAAAGWGLVLLLIMLIRTSLGMASQANPRRIRQFVSVVLVIVVLSVSSGIGWLFQPDLHMAQARYHETRQEWVQALKQYQLGGEKTPTSANLARVYVEWGEALNQKKQYDPAIDKYLTVIYYYTDVSAMQNRALKNRLQAYIDWGKQALDQKDFVNARLRFDYALTLINCDAVCKKTINPLDAPAYYAIGKSQLDNKAYTDAIITFRTIVSKFPDTNEAKLLHGDLAKALLAQGQQDRSKSCGVALPVYKELANNFKDTPEGQQAANEMAQPQPIKGRFTKDLVPAYQSPEVFLLQGLTVDNEGELTISDSEFWRRAGNAISVRVQPDGSFAFPPLKQDTYQLLWRYYIGSITHYQYYYNVNKHNIYYEAQVGPLCPFDFGEIEVSFNPQN